MARINKSDFAPKYRLAEESRKFTAVFYRHWVLILSMGFFFGWLLSFPMQGPLFNLFVQTNPVNPIFFTVSFLSGLILGFVCAGIIGYFFRSKLQLFFLGAIPCAVLSFCVKGIATEYLWLIFAFLGLFSGMVTISWATAFASLVHSDQRGHTFALTAIISNVILYLFNVMINQQVVFDRLLLIVSILPCVMIASPIYYYKKLRPKMLNLPVENRKVYEADFPIFRNILPFVFSICLVGGLMYAVVDSLSTKPFGFLTFYMLVPYILFLFLAGILSDSTGRRINAIVGAIVIGIGFMALGILEGTLQFIAIQTLLIGGYAFIDVFIWIVPADAKKTRQTPLLYSAVLGINILAILVGVLLGAQISQLVYDAEILTVSLAGVFSFISLAFIIKLREAFHTVNPTVIDFTPEYMENIVWKLCLTPRESEVAKLLVTGASTQEIRDKLVIAPDTLKRHLRNIYRKANVHNRLEFTLSMVNRSEQPEAYQSK